MINIQIINFFIHLLNKISNQLCPNDDVNLVILLWRKNDFPHENKEGYLKK